VTKTFNATKKKAGYSFKQAIKDAKKIYKKTKTAKHFVEKVVERGTRKAHRGSRKHQESHNHRRSRNHRG
jgi:hypothetical protein